MENYDNLQRLFISEFQKIIYASKELSQREFIMIPPTEIPNAKVFVAIYDKATGCGFGLSLNGFLTGTYREHETDITIGRLLDGVIRSIKESKKEPIELNTFMYTMFDKRSKFIESRVVGQGGKARLHIFKLEKVV